MFTGLVEVTGTVDLLDRREGASRLALRAGDFAAGCVPGESIAVNGCCLTVAEPLAGGLPGLLQFDLLEETLHRTNLGALAPAEPVNLERALRADARLGGHFVQGHIDCTAAILGWEQAGGDYRLEVGLPAAFAQYVVEKGSIAIDGISLTVAELKPESFVAWIIPHTRAHTNLSAAAPGRAVNLEFDMLAKYVERLLGRAGKL